LYSHANYHNQLPIHIFFFFFDDVVNGFSKLSSFRQKIIGIIGNRIDHFNKV
jgi:hypothetical protein